MAAARRANRPDWGRIAGTTAASRRRRGASPGVPPSTTGPVRVFAQPWSDKESSRLPGRTRVSPRDGFAAEPLRELLGAATNRGYGATILNHPGDPECTSPDVEGALIVHVARPALDDDPEMDKVCIPRSGLLLEKAMHRSARTALRCVDSGKVILDARPFEDGWPASVKPDDSFKAVRFALNARKGTERQRGFAVHRAAVSRPVHLEAARGDSNDFGHTVAYLLWQPRVRLCAHDEAGRFSLLLAFGMTDRLSEIFTHALCRRAPELIHEIVNDMESSRLLVVEFRPELDGGAPAHHTPVHDWRIVVDQRWACVEV